MENGKNDEGFMGFRRPSAKAPEIIERTKERAANLMKFPMRFLNDTLGGISQTDLIILTGSSGGGKSEMVFAIAKALADQGKQVALLALESYQGEVESRLVYKECVRLYFADIARQPGHPNYQDWHYGGCTFLNEYLEEACTNLRESMGNRLWIRCGAESLDADDIEAAFMSAAKECDVVILDHLHYIDFGADNELLAQKNILKKFSELILHYEVPLILVAHIRKRDRRIKQLVPDIEDIHGSSDIFKIAWKSIAIGRGEFDPSQPTKWPTLIKVNKNRIDGSRTYYMGLVNFDSQRNAYEDQYALGREGYEKGKPVWEPLEDNECPYWYKTKIARMLSPED